MAVRALQPLKDVLRSSDGVVARQVTVARASQPANAESPILVSPSCRMIEVREKQAMNALYPSPVIPCGNLTVISVVLP